MKFELTESCTDEILTVDGLILDDTVPNYILKGYLHILINTLPTSFVSLGLLKEIMQHHAITEIESLGHCETCGDYPHKYSLELE